MGWHNFFTREYSVQYAEVIISSFGRKGDSRASFFRSHILYPENNNVSYYVNEQEYRKLLEIVDDLIENYLDDEIARFHDVGKEYVDEALKIHGIEVEKLENPQLLDLYACFIEKWISYTSYLWSMFITAEIVAEKTEKILEDRSEELIHYATYPTGKASGVKLNAALRELKADYSEQKMEKVYQDFRWISCLDIQYLPWTREHFAELIKHEHPPEEIPKMPDIELSQQDRKLITLNKKMAHIKDMRDEYRRIGIYHAQKLFIEIARRMSIDLKEVAFLTIPEIMNFLGGGTMPDMDVLSQRHGRFMVFEENDMPVCIVGEAIEETAKKLGFVPDRFSHDEIKGKPASKGNAKGTARIVVKEDDLAKVSKGDVLVAVTTGASYVPAMAKACAFVTDQGGITCHAAIIAREMKKPCIVGTMNATQALKDGDLVEVDANQGIVRVLE